MVIALRQGLRAWSKEVQCLVNAGRDDVNLRWNAVGVEPAVVSYDRVVEPLNLQLQLAVLRVVPLTHFAFSTDVGIRNGTLRLVKGERELGLPVVGSRRHYRQGLRRRRDARRFVSPGAARKDCCRGEHSQHTQDRPGPVDEGPMLRRRTNIR